MPSLGQPLLRQNAELPVWKSVTIEETDPVSLALLEIYVAIALGTPHNDFDNHQRASTRHCSWLDR